jgi:hypothetical protein
LTGQDFAGETPMRRKVSSLMRAVFAAAALLVFADAARADAIDGDWCHADGRRFSIRGPQIVTPGGLRMEGNYSRHWFSYKVPTAEPAAGSTVNMTLVNENTVHLRVEAASADEVWIRCSPTTSSLKPPPPA